MQKIKEQWFLFRYIEGQLTPFSKPFKTKQLAEKARQKYPDREQKTIAIGMVRVKA